MCVCFLENVTDVASLSDLTDFYFCILHILQVAQVL